jgi:hypothetical protein
MLTYADVCSMRVLAPDPDLSVEWLPKMEQVFILTVSIRTHTYAYVSIRKHTSAYVSIRVASQNGAGIHAYSQHMSAYVSIRTHTSAYVSIRNEWLPKMEEVYILAKLGKGGGVEGEGEGKKEKEKEKER